MGIRLTRVTSSLAGSAAGLVVIAACGSSNGSSRYGSASGNAPAASATALTAAITTPAAPLATAATVGTPPASQSQAATPAVNPIARVSGTVQGIAGNTVSLQDGSSFTITLQTAITRRAPSTAAALQQGNVVAITAMQQPDNSLLASLVTVFRTPPNGFGLGQRPLDGGNLMTNATIDKLQSNGFTVTFPGGGAQVTLAPDAQITELASGTAADITAGATLSAAVKDGVAQSISIQ